MIALDLKPGYASFRVVTVATDTLPASVRLDPDKVTFLTVKQSDFTAEAGRADAELLVRWAEFLKYPEGWPLLIPAANQFLEYLDAAWKTIELNGTWWFGAKGFQSDLDYLVRELSGTDEPFLFQSQGSFRDRAIPEAHIFAGLVRRPITPWGNPPRSHMADYLCSVDTRTVAVSPGGVKPVTDWELNNVYVGVPIVQPDDTTTERLRFYLENGRWLLPHGGDPGPRAASTPESSPIVNIDAVAVAADLAVKLQPYLKGE